LKPCDGFHRGTYEVSREKLELVHSYLRNHLGKISRAKLARDTGLSKDQVNRAIDALSFGDPRLWENDKDQLFYL